MAFCTLAGIDVPCRIDSTQDDAAMKIGGEVVTFQGALRSTIYARKRRWTLATAKIPRTTIQSLITACDSGQTVVLTGDIVGGASINVKASVADQPWHVAFTPFWQSTTISVKEI